ncbi:DUF4136 domain-containing protein [Kistimonas asteriae]|uniref:DUF4136 domain-containing protein n=1 Tax=Kistimonas asteriae TaxID=517724 RepID=UPI001BA6D21C|nr:DUF4136 domain-containing protein [Kistimonas asteriae]
MMKPIKTFMFLLLSLVLVACSSIKVDRDFDPGYQYTSLSRYAWLPQTDNKDDYDKDSLQDRRIRAAVEHTLTEQGYQQVSPDQADFLVHYFTGSKTRRDESHVTVGMGYHTLPWSMGARTETRVRDYEEGQLTLDIIDPASRQLIWRGVAKRRLPETSTPEKRTVYIQEAVQETLAAFPPKATIQ